MVLSKELWRQHERERGEACMEYLATRFAGFDGASAITHIFPCLLNVSITQLSIGSGAQHYGVEKMERITTKSA